MTGIDRTNISVAAPVMMKELDFNAGVMGIVFSSFFWAYLLFNIPSGILADRFGPKIVYGIAAALWSVATTITGAAHSLFLLVACRFGLGIGEAVVFPISSKVVSEQFLPAQRGTVTGIYMAGYRLGMAITPIFSAWIITQWGWQTCFYFCGAVSFVWVALWVFTYPSMKENVPSAAPKKKFSWAVTKTLLSNRNTLAIIIIKFLSDYLVYMIITWLPGYLYMERKFTIVKMGIYASLPWIAGMIALPLVGMISDNLIKSGKTKTFARKVPLVISQLLASMIIFTPWIASPTIAVWLLIFVVTVESAVSGVLWTIPPEIAPSGEAGTLGGIMNTAGSLAGILSPIITGYIVVYTGSFTAAFIVAAACIALSAFFVTFFLGEIKPMDIEKA
jgi:ACS family glucarate transporter-like MFS transporter